MVKVVKFMLIALFLFFLVPGCNTVSKAIPNEPLDEAKKITSSAYPLAYEFNLNDLSGNKVSLSSYKDKKNVVLVFWTTWCPYCREALRNLQADFKSLSEMGIELLAINVGESEYKVNSFAQNYNFSFRILLDQYGSVADHYDLFGVPTYVIINKSGQIVSSGNSFIKEKLKELTTK